MAGCFFAAGAILFPPDPSLYFLIEGGGERTLLAMASLLLAMYFFDLYSDIHVLSRVQLLQELCQAVGVAFLVQSVIEYTFRDFILPHYMMLYGGAFTLLALFCWRMLYSAVLLQALGREKVLFVGRNSTVDEVVSEIVSDPTSGYEVLGFLEDDAPLGTAFADAPVLGSLSDLTKVAFERKPARIVVGLSERRAHMPVPELLQLRFAGSRIEEAATTYEMVYRRVCSRNLSPVTVLFRRELIPPANALRVAALLNRVLAALLLLVLLPLLLLIAGVLRLTSRNPIFLKLPRLGKDGRPFSMLRFRDAGRPNGLFKRLGLAALPELWNVVRGEMALVGPRPASEVHALQQARELPLYDYRHNVCPGMTGWAQINGSTSDAGEPLRQLEFDLYYIKHMSQALNAYILLNTFKNRVLRVQTPVA